VLVSKTDWQARDGALFETHLERNAGTECHYSLTQSLGDGTSVSKTEETVYLNRDQAIEIAKTILRNEGINIG